MMQALRGIVALDAFGMIFERTSMLFGPNNCCIIRGYLAMQSDVRRGEQSGEVLAMAPVGGGKMSFYCIYGGLQCAGEPEHIPAPALAEVSEVLFLVGDCL